MFLKLCKKLLFSIITLLCCYCIFHNFAIISSAKSEVDTTIGVERVEAPNEVIEFIVDKAVEIVSDVLDDPTYLGISDFSTNDIQVMDPYILYTKQNDGSFKENDIYYFPVISNQKVLFTIDVFMTPEGYNYSVANELGEILTQLIDNDDCMRLYVDNGENFSKCEYQYYSIESNVNSIQNEENLRSRGIITEDKLNVLIDIDLEDNNQYQSNHKEKISYPTQGFSVNDNTTKRLDMTNCLVSQADYSCAIPCIATIYRYRTATHGMTSSSLDSLNNSYGFDVKTTGGQVSLLNRIMPAPVQNRYKENWTPVNQLLVQHNINNQFPILLGATSDAGAHAFVIEGYRMSDDKMKWYVFNPWGYGTETPYYSNGTTYYFSSGGKMWHQTGGSCLLIP